MKYGRYEIVKELGKGAMGVVYQAHDPKINRMIALKVLRQDRVTSEDFIQRFLKEAMAIGRLSHPNIVTIYDVGQDHGTIYIAMEYLEGRPFNEVIREKRLGREEIADIAIQLADSLDYAHGKGIVHRDIKPSNIIINAQGKVKITDFGIARIEDPTAIQQTQAGEILGTPIYMSPEQVMGQRLDGRSDLYSLGVILYEITIGKKPYRGENLAAVFRAITQDIPQEPSKADPAVPAGLSKLIMKSLDKDINRRFQKGADMAQAFRLFLKEISSETDHEVPDGKRTENLPLFVGVFLLILALAGGALFYYSTRTVADEVLNIGMVQEKAPLNVQSYPEGAQVYIDSTFMGKTPISTNVVLGKHELRLSLPDYYEWEAQLNVETKEEVPLFVKLIPTDETADQ